MYSEELLKMTQKKSFRLFEDTDTDLVEDHGRFLCDVAGVAHRITLRFRVRCHLCLLFYYILRKAVMAKL